MTDFVKLSGPAQRALANAGYTEVEQLAGVSQDEFLRLHGLGPSAIAPLREALEALGLPLA